MRFYEIVLFSLVFFGIPAAVFLSCDFSKNKSYPMTTSQKIDDIRSQVHQSSTNQYVPVGVLYGGTARVKESGIVVKVIANKGNGLWLCRIDNGPEANVRYAEVTFRVDELEKTN